MGRVGKAIIAAVAVAVLLLGSLGSILIGSGGTAAAQGGSPAQAAPGYLVQLRADPIDAHTRVAARPETGRLGARGATFEVDYIGFTPEARVAFQRAVDIWAAQISSPVPIKVQANWQSLQSGVLGQAGPSKVLSNWDSAPTRDTWYPIATANQIAGRDLLANDPDITAQFNSTFTNWYFGLDGRPPTGQFDFVSVVLHELGHGLGFLGSMQVAGNTVVYGSSGFPFIYDRFAVTGTGLPILTFPSGTDVLLTQVTGGNLFFNGPNSVAANGGANPRLYAPNPFESGSSYSHLDEATYAAGNPNSLMTPKIGRAEAIHDPGPITRGIFRDTGWAIVDGSTTATPTRSPTPAATTGEDTPTPTATSLITATTTPGTTTVTATPGTTTVTATPGTTTATATRTPDESPTPASTPTVTPTYTPTPLGIPAQMVFLPFTLRGNTGSVTGTVTATVTASPSATGTVTGTATVTSTVTITPTGTVSATISPTLTPTGTITATVSATMTPTGTITGTGTPTITPTGTITATGTVTGTRSPTATPTPAESEPSPATATGTVSPTATPPVEGLRPDRTGAAGRRRWIF